MPIKPDRMASYPGGSIKSPEWLAIRARIQARAGDCCEACGVCNGLIGVRLPDGEFMETPGYREGDMIGLLVSPMFFGLHMTPAPVEHIFKVFKIVCTVAHRDGELVDHSDANLVFLCQRDHNKLDAPSRAKNAAATRKANRPVTLLDLMGVP